MNCDVYECKNVAGYAYSAPIVYDEVYACDNCYDKLKTVPLDWYVLTEEDLCSEIKENHYENVKIIGSVLKRIMNKKVS